MTAVKARQFSFLRGASSFEEKVHLRNKGSQPLGVSEVREGVSLRELVIF